MGRGVCCKMVTAGLICKVASYFAQRFSFLDGAASWRMCFLIPAALNVLGHVQKSYLLRWENQGLSLFSEAWIFAGPVLSPVGQTASDSGDNGGLWALRVKESLAVGLRLCLDVHLVLCACPCGHWAGRGGSSHAGSGLSICPKPSP